MKNLTKFRKNILFLLLVVNGASFSTAVSAGIDTMQDEINMLYQRINTLEASQKEFSDAAEQWTDKITIGGHVAINTFYTDYGHVEESDILIYNSAIWAEAKIATDVTALLLFYYEDGDDAPEVDQAIITLSAGQNLPLTFTAGRTYLPFGKFESNMISYPFTYDLGRTREDLLMADFETDGFYGAAYIFNGDIDETGSDDLVGNYGFNFGYRAKNNKNSLDFGIGWVSSIEESDGVEKVLHNYGVSSVAERTDAIAVYANGRFGAISIFTEYVGALDNLGGKNSNTQVKAWNIEAGYDFTMRGMDSTVALGYQETSQAEALDLHEERIIGAIRMEVMQDTTLAFELKQEKDYAGDDAHTGTAQLAVTF